MLPDTLVQPYLFPQYHQLPTGSGSSDGAKLGSFFGFLRLNPEKIQIPLQTQA